MYKKSRPTVFYVLISRQLITCFAVFKKCCSSLWLTFTAQQLVIAVSTDLQIVCSVEPGQRVGCSELRTGAARVQVQGPRCVSDVRLARLTTTRRRRWGSVGEERRAESETAHRSSVVGSDPLLKGASQHL